MTFNLSRARTLAGRLPLTCSTAGSFPCGIWWRDYSCSFWLLCCRPELLLLCRRELVKEPVVRAAFLRTPLVELGAYAALHFLELLVGPKAAGLNVKDPAKLGAPNRAPLHSLHVRMVATGHDRCQGEGQGFDLGD